MKKMTGIYICREDKNIKLQEIFPEAEIQLEAQVTKGQVIDIALQENCGRINRRLSIH
mgnify:CR=1 FL=1